MEPTPNEHSMYIRFLWVKDIKVNIGYLLTTMSTLSKLDFYGTRVLYFFLVDFEVR